MNKYYTTLIIVMSLLIGVGAWMVFDSWVAGLMIGAISFLWVAKEIAMQKENE